MILYIRAGTHAHSYWVDLRNALIACKSGVLEMTREETRVISNTLLREERAWRVIPTKDSDLDARWRLCCVTKREPT